MKLLYLTVVLLLATPFLEKTGCLHAAQAEQWVYAPPYGPNVQLLKDPAFNNGFRAFLSCRTFQGDQPACSPTAYGHTGNCIDYYSPYVNTLGRNYAVRTWPDLGAPGDNNKYWHFNEGIHSGITVGPYVFPLGQDLAVHRLEANQENNAGVLISAPSDQYLIWLQETNNLVQQNNPNLGTLVRTVSSDRHGFLMMYMNTKNEIRNDPSSSGTDTWPHFYVEQNFKQVIDLAVFNQVYVSADVAIPFVFQLDGWPGSFKNATCSIGVLLRKKENPCDIAFIGYILHSAIGENERSVFDQNGAPIYNGNNSDVGGSIVLGANARQVFFDLRILMAKAIAASPPGRFLVLDDYYLAGFGFGWETVGYHQVKSEISNVSVTGWPRTLFDAEVYQDSIYKSLNGFPANDSDYSAGQRRAHWAKGGAGEGRVASSTFDVKIYAQRWGSYMPQCFNSGVPNYPCAIAHYVSYGRAAGHPGHW